MCKMSKQQKDNVKNDEAEHVPCFCSQRWILAYVSYLGFLCIYAVRFNMSVGIICMVRTEFSNTTSNSVNHTAGICEGSIDKVEASNRHAEFDWDKDTRSNILSAFFYGYVLTQIPGGWMADRFGGRRVLGIALAIGGICTVLTPVCARTSIILVYIVRVVLGIASGVSFPAMQSMWGRWAPPRERTKLISFYSLGPFSGSIVTFIGSGYLCEYGFDNGWGSIFYVTGGVTLLWVLVWFLMIRDTPSVHPWITEAEKKYICGSIEFDVDKKKIQVPWKAIVKSVPMYSCMTAQICAAWMGYTILTSIPDFMKSVLKFDIQSNGLFSALPYLCYVFMAFIGGQSADFIRQKGILTTTSTRKLYTSLAFLGSTVFIILAGFTTCHQRYITVAYLCLAMGFSGLSRAGFAVNHVDFAAKYAGVLMGITNMCANIPGILSPVVAGKLTPNSTSEEWRNVFYVCAAFNIVGALVFGFFASGEVQEWATDKKEQDIIVTAPPVTKF